MATKSDARCAGRECRQLYYIDAPIWCAQDKRRALMIASCRVPRERIGFISLYAVFISRSFDAKAPIDYRPRALLTARWLTLGYHRFSFITIKIRRHFDGQV